MLKIATSPVLPVTEIAQNGDPRKPESYRSVRQPFGAMPEQIPPAEHINEVEKRIKSTPLVLELKDSW